MDGGVNDYLNYSNDYEDALDSSSYCAEGDESSPKLGCCALSDFVESLFIEQVIHESGVGAKGISGDSSGDGIQQGWFFGGEHNMVP